jgi:hypothetical protein
VTPSCWNASSCVVRLPKPILRPTGRYFARELVEADQLVGKHQRQKARQHMGVQMALDNVE